MQKYVCQSEQVLKTTNDDNDKIVAKKGAVATFVDTTIAMFPSRETNGYFKDRMETYLTFNPDKVK